MQTRYLSIPLLILLSAACRTTSSEPASFRSGEQAIDLGYTSACTTTQICPKSLTRKDGNLSFTYSEIVAFSGDFYGTPEALYEENRQNNLWAPLADDISYAKNLFTMEASTIEQQIRGREIKYPDFNVKYLVAYPSFLELSATNSDHFGWHNMKAYVKYHSMALAAAMDARFNPKDKTLLTKALFFNAFADHFLADGFAGGHVRVPRAQGISWGTRMGYRSEAVGAIAKVLHDNDHAFANDGGLSVGNARGDKWKTRPDSELFQTKDPEDSAVRMVKEAITMSVQEVLDVYQGQDIPAGVFLATELVPFVTKNTRDLTEDFPATLSEKEIRSKYLEKLGLVWSARNHNGLSPLMAREYFADLPKQMSEFRMMVKADALDPELARRLPKAYVDGYVNVH